MEFTREIKSRSEIYRQRGKVCSGSARGSFRTPTLRRVASRRAKNIVSRATIRRETGNAMHNRSASVSAENEPRTSASAAHNGQPVGRKAPRKLRNARRRDVLRVVTRNAGRVVKDERHLRGRRGFDAMVTLNEI